MKVGIIGLGSIAQRVYLPILSRMNEINLIGAFTPNQVKGLEICSQYNITYFTTANELIDAVDVVFIHAATQAHVELVTLALDKGKAIYIDKPLAFNMEDSLRLVKSAKDKKIPLMIGFNRRFAPAYRQLKSRFHQPTFIHVEKHRPSISEESVEVTMLDDFIHVIDTLIWFVDNRFELLDVEWIETDEGYLDSVNVTAKSDKTFLLATMHRNSGTNLEKVTVIDQGKTMSVENLDTIEVQTKLETTKQILTCGDNEKRGFVEIIRYFIETIEQQKPLMNSGTKSLKSQEIIDEILRNL